MFDRELPEKRSFGLTSDDFRQSVLPSLHVAALNGGFSNVLSGSTDGLLKTFNKGAEIARLSAEARFSNELGALLQHDTLERGGIRVPRVLGADRNLLTLSLEFVEADYANIDSSIRNGTLAGDDTAGFIKGAGRILSLIHQVHPRTEIGSEAIKYCLEVTTAIQSASSLLSTCGLDPNELFVQVMKRTDFDAMSKIGCCFVHGDFWLNNLLYSRADGWAVLDWEYSGMHSPLRDLAQANLMIARSLPDGEMFWEGYGVKPQKELLEACSAALAVQNLSCLSIDSYKAAVMAGRWYFPYLMDYLRDFIQSN